MKILKILSIVVLLTLMPLGANSQNGYVFVGSSLGTQGAGDKFFKGANVSMEAGYYFKGLDVSAYVGFYNTNWGRNVHNNMNYTSYQNKEIINKNLDGSENVSELALRLTIGYDFLHFIKGNWRHHLTPYIGLGYAQKRVTKNEDSVVNGLAFSSLSEQINSGFEFTIGGAYDFNVVEHWSIGLFFEESMHIRERDIIGLRTRYIF